MNKQKILICGGTGFIGRNFVERYAKNSNYDVHATYFTRPSYDVKGVTWHKVDLKNPDSIDALAQGKDIIVQAAATTSGSKDIVARPYIHVTDNAIMNSYLFRAAFQHQVKHVIFFSCTIMYQSSAKPLKETDFDANLPLYPKYFGAGHTKLYLEKMCEFYAGIGKTKFTAVRHSNIYGPHDKYDLERSHFFGATITKVMTAKDHISVWGTGEEERDMLHVNDLIAFVEKAIQNQTANYRLYNCGYGKSNPVIEIIKKIIEYSGKKIRIEHDLSKPTIKTNLCLDCTLAKEEIDWERMVSLEAGIKDTLRWYEENVIGEKQTNF